MSQHVTLMSKCVSLAGKKPIAGILLHELALKLLMFRAKRIRIGGRTYIPKSIEWWAGELGFSDSQIKRAVRTLRDEGAILCEYPGGGFLHIALHPDAEKELVPLLERQKRRSKNARSPSDKNERCDSANTHDAIDQICTESIEVPSVHKTGSANAHKNGKEQSTNQAPGGDHTLTLSPEEEKIWKAFCKGRLGAKLTEQELTEKRRGFLSDLCGAHGGKAALYVRVLCVRWHEFRETILKQNPKANIKIAPDLANMTYAPETVEAFCMSKSKDIQTYQSDPTCEPVHHGPKKFGA